jgi:hypothetical protein
MGVILRSGLHLPGSSRVHSGTKFGMIEHLGSTSWQKGFWAKLTYKFCVFMRCVSLLDCQKWQFLLDSYENYNLIISKVITASVIMNKDKRNGRWGRLTHKHCYPPPIWHNVSTLLKKTKDCRKEKRLRTFDTKASCIADVSSLPSINNVIVIS